jgi:uncharacterized membrane protein YdbT with pleckstrin-like domain
MDREFKSGISLSIVVPLAIILTGTFIWMIVLRIWPGAILLFLFILLVTYLFKNTDYLLTHRRTLIIKRGFLFKKEIDIDQITTIQATKSALAAPALSLHRSRSGTVSLIPSLFLPAKKPNLL